MKVLAQHHLDPAYCPVPREHAFTDYRDSYTVESPHIRTLKVYVVIVFMSPHSMDGVSLKLIILSQPF